MNAIAANNGAVWQASKSMANRPGGEARQHEEPTKISFGVTLLAIYIFVLTSRALDVSKIAILHLPMFLLIAVAIAALAKGGLQQTFKSRITIYCAMLNAWVLLCFPFSSWRGGSLPFVISSLESFGIYLAIVQLVRTEREWRRIANAYAFGVLGASIISFVLGQSIDGRLAVASGTLADPNEFALRLLLGLPFWWHFAAQSKTGGKLIGFLMTVPILVAFGRAGSRSGLLALLTLVLVMFVFVNIKQKVVMGVVAVLALTAGIAFLPSYLKVRFTTIFQKHDVAKLDAVGQARLGADVGSSEGRELLLWQGIQMTLEHPIVGVGPGVFGETAWNERKARQGVGGMMMVSHNTYTQTSSELGLPGLFFFVAALFLSIKYALTNYRSNRENNPALAKSNLYLFASFIGLAVGIFFLSVGYSMLLAIMFGLAASLNRVTREAPVEAEAPANAEVLPPHPAKDASKSPMRFPKAARERRHVRFGRIVERNSGGR